MNKIRFVLFRFTRCSSYCIDLHVISNSPNRNFQFNKVIAFTVYNFTLRNVIIHCVNFVKFWKLILIFRERARWALMTSPYIFLKTQDTHGPYGPFVLSYALPSIYYALRGDRWNRPFNTSSLWKEIPDRCSRILYDCFLNLRTKYIIFDLVFSVELDQTMCSG